MNLYIFNKTSSGAVFGIGTYIRELTSGLHDSHIHVSVISLLSDQLYVQSEEIDGIRYLYFPAPNPEDLTTKYQKQKPLYYRNVVYLLQKQVKDKKDLVFRLNYHQSEILAEELKKVFDCKVVTVIHYSGWGFTVYDNLSRLRNILKEEKPDNFGIGIKKSVEDEKTLYSNVDRVICLSNYMQEILYLDYGLETAKISVIPNGLTDLAKKKSVEGLRKKWNLSGREKIILFAGRMDEIKGVEYLIKAFRELLKVYPQCRLVIAGSGSFDQYTKESQDICTKITYTGFLEKSQIHEWYCLSDVGVVPSLFEPFGYVAVEMMMHRLPLVVTATSGLNEVVDDTCGLKVPLTILSDKVEIDTTLLAQKILYLLQHPAEARKLGRNGRKRYLKEYTLEIFRRNMLDFYSSLFMR